MSKPIKPNVYLVERTDEPEDCAYIIAHDEMGAAKYFRETSGDGDFIVALNVSQVTADEMKAQEMVWDEDRPGVTIKMSTALNRVLKTVKKLPAVLSVSTW